MKTAAALALALVIVLFADHRSLYAADAAAGKEIYLKKCKSCHGEDGNSTPAMQKTFGDKLRPLGSAEVQGMSDDALAKAFKDGTRHKSVATGVSDADLANLIAFIRTLKK